MRNVTSQLLFVHPMNAVEWLTTENFPRQRALRPFHVKYLSQIMHHGRWLHGTQIHFVRLPNGKRYLINGQHTLAAIIDSGIAVWLTVQESEVDSEEEAAILYGRHDRGLARTLSDAYQAHGFSETYGLPHEDTNRLGAAIPLIVTGFAPIAHYRQTYSFYLRDQDIRWQYMIDWVEELRAYRDDIAGSPEFLRRALLRAAVLSIALVTYRYTGADASEFWAEVARDNGLKTDHPAKTLIRFLIQTPVKTYPAPRYARYVAAAWNAFFEERTVRTLQARPLPLPLFLAGTPHDGKRIYQYCTEEGALLHDPVVGSIDAMFRARMETATARREEEGELLPSEGV